ncbi:MAG TPA: NAD(P)H-binding protein [Solirubrobacterales bacterium]|nr:NAD(P)H-binding protein [Solirubrobacterales bacterium]
MILLTGATGVVGSELLPGLLADGHQVRTLVRDPRKLGEHRVDVQITLGDVGDPFSLRHAMRGVDTVIHLAATIRDQPGGTIEEVNGLGTARLLRSAERSGAERFVFFSAMNATGFQRTRFFRSKAVAEHGVRESPLATTVFAPSIVYRPGDPWITLLQRFALLPAVPISGSGHALYQPIWARDVARCVVASLGTNGSNPDRRYELAGPEVLSYDDIVEVVLEASGRGRPLVHVPLPLVHAGLRALELLAGPSVFATWEEAELMEVPMTTERGAADVEELGVEPRPMGAVLGARG